MDISTFYFLLAKLINFLLNPWSVFVAGLIVSYVLIMTRAGLRWGRVLLSLVLGCYVLFGMFPVGTHALNVLEERFPVTASYEAPVAGIMVLGGSVDTTMTRERDQVAVASSADRLTSFVRLAREHPEAQLLYIGGQGRVFDRHPSEAEVTKRLLTELGMDVSRVRFEGRSRNTEEGAQMAYDLIQPEAVPWVLITSASHMPRAVGLFREAGWRVLPHPVDFTTLPSQRLSWMPSWPGGLGAFKNALYEWAALLVAWARGKISEPFPGPKTLSSPE